MNDGDALLLAVVRNPDDDTPRLIYADWLQENGQPERAEFIRVQCELARLPPDDPRRHDLRRREGQLLAETRGECGQPTPRLFPRQPEMIFARGFVEKHYLWHNWVESEELFHEVVTSRESLWLTRLRFSDGQLNDRTAPILATCPYLRRLCELFSEGSASAAAPPAKRLTAVGVAALAASPFLAGLTELTLSAHGLDDAAVRALAAAGSLTQLTTLDLRQNAITDDGVAALVASPALPRLESLGLSENPGGPLYEDHCDWDGTVLGGGVAPWSVEHWHRKFGNRFRVF